MSDIIKKQQEIYRHNFVKHGDSPAGLFWNNVITQHERFEQILAPLLDLKPSGFSICDIGSGTCDLHQYLLDKNIKHTYTGIEIVPEMIEKSKAKFKNIDIRSGNILNKKIDQGKFDFVVLSGTFNLPGKTPRKEWETYVQNVVKRMFSMSMIGISFNALTSYSDKKVKDLFYLSPDKTLAFIQKSLSRFCIVNTAYPLYEVTYSVLHEKGLMNKFSHPDFAKYFKANQSK